MASLEFVCKKGIRTILFLNKFKKKRKKGAGLTLIPRRCERICQEWDPALAHLDKDRKGNVKKIV